MAAVEGLTKIPELRRRLFFTLGMLAIYRLGCHIPVPGINQDILNRFFESKQGTLFSMLNMFSGRALENASIFALGIMPAVTASIILQLLRSVYPYLKELSKDALGQRKLNQYSRYLTVFLAVFQGFGVATALTGGSFGADVVVGGWSDTYFKFVTVVTLGAGTAFIMWLGEQITERGIGNGTSLIIFSGIASGIPVATQQTLQLVRTGQLSPLMFVLLIALMLGVVAVIVFLEMGQRRIPIQYARRQQGRTVYGGQTVPLPLKINVSGVMPPILASSLMMAPITVLSYFPDAGWAAQVRDVFTSGGTLYYTLYVTLIVSFAFFYAGIVFEPNDVAQNLQKYGGYVPGIRPGQNTAEYIEKVLTRLTVGGAVYLALVCLMPDLVRNRFKVSFYFGGTTLLILVGVAMDTMEKIQAFLVNRDYEGFMKSAKLRGRRG